MSASLSGDTGDGLIPVVGGSSELSRRRVQTTLQLLGGAHKTHHELHVAWQTAQHRRTEDKTQSPTQ